MQYRHNFSSGDGEWEWVDIEDQEPEVYIQVSDIKSEYDFSEHYRGVEIGFVVSRPPTEILEKKFKELSEKIKSDLAYRSKLIEMIENK